MKTLTVKHGTKKEILDYLKGEIKDMEEYPPPTRPRLKRFEDQIDEAINSGSPFVSIHVDTGYHMGRGFTPPEMFLIQDYTDLKLDMEMKKLDDTERRKKFMDGIKIVMEMDLDAQERWSRIVKIVREFQDTPVFTLRWNDKIS